MNETTISYGTQVWLRVTARRLRGEGRLLPQLVFDVSARTPREQMQAHIQHLRARLVIAGEAAGTGDASGLLVGPHGTDFSIEIPVAPQALDFAKPSSWETGST